MKEFDHNGLMLAEYQGKLFEKSVELDCSSSIFIRRFLHSELLNDLDNSKSISFDINEGIKSILEQFGDSSYGKVKKNTRKQRCFGLDICIDILPIQENRKRVIL